MPMVAYQQYFPESRHDKTEVLTLHSAKGELPAGEYLFVDMYCTDEDCDCRRAMIKVLNNRGRLQATLSYGWENKAFYAKWMGGNECVDEIPGVNVYPLQIQGEGYLELEKEYATLIKANKAYALRLQKRYQTFKAKVEAEAKANKPKPAISNKVQRNELCPCDSGKKYKKCCQNAEMQA